MVADTERNAQYATNKVVASYLRDDGDPIITNADAIARNSYFEGMKRHHQRGDFATGIAAAEHTLVGKCSSKTQLHWYVEPQTAWAVPDEGGKMIMGSALQWADGRSNPP